jgi:hypothetical protein
MELAILLQFSNSCWITAQSISSEYTEYTVVAIG